MVEKAPRRIRVATTAVSMAETTQTRIQRWHLALWRCAVLQVVGKAEVLDFHETMCGERPVEARS